MVDEIIGGRLGQLVRDWFPIVMLIVSGLVWGMKLEARYDVLETRLSSMQAGIARIEAQTSAGILPITAEKLAAARERLEELERRVDRIEARERTP